MITDYIFIILMAFSGLYFSLLYVFYKMKENSVEFWFISALIFSFMYFYGKIFSGGAWKILYVVLSVLIIITVILVFFIIGFGLINKKPKKADFILLLGADENTIGKKVFDKRIQKCFEVSSEFPYAPIIVSGKNEAKIAAVHLIDMGIVPDRIITDENSQTTLQNLINSGKFFKTRENVVIITSGFHKLRTQIYFNILFPHKSVSFQTNSYGGIRIIHFAVREIMCFTYDVLSRRIFFAKKIQKTVHK